MVRDAFGNQIILSEKLINCTISINNQKYNLPLTWVKPFNKEKTTQFILGMNFIKNQFGGLIVQGDIVTIFKRADMIYTTPFVKETIACTEEGYILFQKEEDHELQIEFNQLEPLRQKLAPIIEALKIDGTIGENPIRNMHRTKEECTLQILNPDIRLTCPVIKATPYEQTEFDLHIKELKQLEIIADTQSHIGLEHLLLINIMRS